MISHASKLIAAGAVLTAVGMAPAPPADAAQPRTRQVTIDRTSYAPATVYVHLGDTVVWTNDDLFPHTVTSEAGGFDSKDIAKGKSWSFTPTEKGRFDYLCIYHDSMRGTLVVR